MELIHKGQVLASDPGDQFYVRQLDARRTEAPVETTTALRYSRAMLDATTYTNYGDRAAVQCDTSFRTEFHRVQLLCLLSAVSCASIAAQGVVDAGDLYKRSSPAVVTIEALGDDGKIKKTGSGLLTSADGRLLTNFHVISSSKNATVRLANGDAYDRVDVISIDKRKDIAYLKIPAVDLPFLKLGRSAGVEIGQTVYSIGSPMGLKNTISQGLVSGIRELDGYRLFQISAPISSGSSGGPIFNINGEVIGIAVLTLSTGQNLNFAIPIDYARGMLSITQVQPLASVYEPEPTPDAPEAPDSKSEATKALSSNTVREIPEEMRRGSFAFLEKKLGSWTLADAKETLGNPIRQRDAYLKDKVDGIIYAFPDPTGAAKEFELNFSMTGVLRALYGYPQPGSLKFDVMQKAVGRNYKETKYPDGRRGYFYNDRRLIVIVNKEGFVYNFGVYLP